MALKRDEPAIRVLRGADLPLIRDGRRVRIAGTVITRQWPGTAKAFVIVTLGRKRMTVIRQPFLKVAACCRTSESVLSVRTGCVEAIDSDASVDTLTLYLDEGACDRPAD